MTSLIEQQEAMRQQHTEKLMFSSATVLGGPPPIDGDGFTANHNATPTGPTSAPEFLTKALALLNERGKQYDQPGGERSMGRTVAAFNLVTRRNGHCALSESEGWLLMQILKDVRQWQTNTFHRDSAEDGVSYSALKAEALASTR